MQDSFLFATGDAELLSVDDSQVSILSLQKECLLTNA